MKWNELYWHISIRNRIFKISITFRDLILPNNNSFVDATLNSNRYTIYPTTNVSVIILEELQPNQKSLIEKWESNKNFSKIITVRSLHSSLFFTISRFDLGSLSSEARNITSAEWNYKSFFTDWLLSYKKTLF